MRSKRRGNLFGDDGDDVTSGGEGVLEDGRVFLTLSLGGRGRSKLVFTSEGRLRTDFRWQVVVRLERDLGEDEFAVYGVVLIDLGMIG